MKNWIKKNELFARLLTIVVAAVISSGLLTTWVVLQHSRTAYITSYVASNEIILDKIQEGYERLHQNTNQIFERVNNSQIVEDYLTKEQTDTQIIIDLQRELDGTATLFQDIPSNLVLIGKNGRSFFQNDNVRAAPVAELLEHINYLEIENNSAVNQFFFQNSGPTTSTKNVPGLLHIRKLQNNYGTFGYALIYITEMNFSKIYRELLNTPLHEVMIVDSENTIISASDQSQLGMAFDRSALIRNDSDRLHEISLYSYNFTFYDYIDENFLAKNMQLIRPTIVISILSILLASFLAFILLRKITSPIYHLIEKLPAVTRGDFSHKVAIEGTYETQQLGKSYNLMLNNLEQYVNDLLATEQEKHLLEIHSLQMQIQPHFIYNTLTALKFLIWQNEQEKASQGITSFINLLQQTFNKRELLSLKEELQITQDYVHLLGIRYGDQIQTTIFSDEQSENILVPKLIIQPIIENAYLHAFPNQQNGYVQIFSSISKDKLKIEIIDNGVGFDNQKLTNVDDKSNHYSSIGLQNINERIHLIYGEPYGLFINSEPNKGTTITLWLPAKQETT